MLVRNRVRDQAKWKGSRAFMSDSEAAEVGKRAGVLDGEEHFLVLEEPE